ncbi:MAG: hypothetical protein ACI3ZY_09215 [Parabacteroides sp.]
MKRLLFVALCGLIAQIVVSNVAYSNCEYAAVESMETVYEISGSTSIPFSGSSVGGSYSIIPTPPNGCTYQWNITGSGACYVYPNASSCSINVYSRGSYRLSCIITFSDGSSTESATYITVY